MVRMHLPMQETGVQSLMWMTPYAAEQLSLQATTIELAPKSQVAATAEPTAPTMEGHAL